MNVTDILSHEELAQLERAVLVARRRRGSVEGETTTTRRTGTSMEFAGVRSYRTGDDFRTIDWNAFRRTGRPVTRVYAAEEQMPLHLLVDVSGSMRLGTPTKFQFARKLAVAFAYLALRNQNHLGAAVLGPAPPAPTGASRGPGQFQRVIRLLSAVEPTGEVDVGSGLLQYAGRVRKPAVVVILTDGLEPGALDRGLRALRLRKAELVVIQVLAQEDLEPPLPSRGAAELEDAETGKRVFVPVSDRTRTEYANRFGQIDRALVTVCRKHRAELIQTTSSASVFPVVMRYLRSGAPL